MSNMPGVTSFATPAEVQAAVKVLGSMIEGIVMKHDWNARLIGLLAYEDQMRHSELPVKAADRQMLLEIVRIWQCLKLAPTMVVVAPKRR
jgi:hypothetical protein